MICKSTEKRAEMNFSSIFVSVLQKNSCLAILGSGVYENRNGNEPMNTAFAAPRGICNGTMRGEPVVFVADSESSTIRVVTLKDGNVSHVVGGDSEPTVRERRIFHRRFVFLRIFRRSATSMEAVTTPNFSIPSALHFIIHRRDYFSPIHSTIN